MLVVLPLVIYFFFWVFNHSEVFSSIFKKVISFLPQNIQYAFFCAFCSGFWASLVVVPFFHLPIYLIFTTPVLAMFINLTFFKLIS